jgi:predicted amidohydrolase
MRDFRVACIALNPKPRHTEENRDAVIEWTGKAAARGARLALFPEGFLSGCSLRSPAPWALPGDSPVLDQIQAAASRHRIVVSVGLLERAGDAIHVSQAYLGKGVRRIYRKCHLTDSERKCCVPGNELSIQDLGFVRMGTQICYDSAFPRASETLILKGAELLYTPTGHCYDWRPGERHDRARAIQRRRNHVCKYWRARAYDYTCYAIYVDNVGNTADKVWFPGYIGVFGPDGEIVAESTSGRETMVMAAMDGKLLAKCRREWVGHYQTLVDSRTELYL